jgi:hypothetical protein
MLQINLKKMPDGSVVATRSDTNDFVVRWDVQYSGKPDYRYKYVMLNCYKYKINWVK